MTETPAVGAKRRRIFAKVHQNGMGEVYCIIVVDGEEIVVLLERSNRALPITI